MSSPNLKETLYKLDLFPTNPTWRINQNYYLNTCKSLFCTLVIVLVSLALSYESIRLMAVHKSQLPIKQVY